VSVSEPLVQSILLGDAVENAPVVILVADEEMRYVAANRFACDVLGYSREELLGLRVTDVARHQEAPAEFAQMIHTGELSGRTTIVRKDGSEVTLDYHASETEIASLKYYVSLGWIES
jgi:PAS domain S-box-containing protein